MVVHCTSFKLDAPGRAKTGLLVSQKTGMSEQDNEINDVLTSPVYPTVALLRPALVAWDWNYSDTFTSTRIPCR